MHNELLSGERRRRRDFESNRAAILGSANDVFTEQGLQATVNSIAEHAGVSPATVYRHFPSRDALVQAVYELRVETYAVAIEDAQKLADPEAAFRATVHAIVALQAKDRAFREIVSSRNVDLANDPVLLRFGAAFLGALQSARDANVLRDGVSEEDVALLLIATEGIARETAAQSETALRRLIDIMLDGLCDHRGAVGGEPLTYEQLIAVSRG